MKVFRLSAGSTVLLVATLGLGGCAWQSPESELHVAVADRAPVEEAAPPARTERMAEVKKVPPKAVVAKAPQRPLKPVDRDEAGCAGVESCAPVLKAMVSGPDRSWVQRPASPAVLANGVRLFAYRSLRSKLACSELATALTEVGAAARTFSGPVTGVAAEQTARVRSLSAEVKDELRAEHTQRCSAKEKQKLSSLQ
jgi:hypothetical protein